MLGSLRFRLTALFLMAVLVFGLVSIALAVRLFQDVTRSQSTRELEREAEGLAALYAESAIQSSDEGTKAPEFAAKTLELATGDELYYIGQSVFPGQRFGLERLRRSALGDVGLQRDRLVTFEFTPPGDDRKLLAAAQPVRLATGTEPFGWLVVAKPVAEVREQWLVLLGRLALALAAGIALAGVLFWWLSRRLTEPVLGLTRATEHVAAGRYDVDIPEASRERRDLAAHGAVPRDGREALRGGAAEALVPHVGLARAPNAAHGDPRPRRGAARRHRHRPRARRGVARDHRRRDRPSRAARRGRPRSREAPGAPVHRSARGGRHGSRRRPGVRRVRGGGAAAGDRLPGRRPKRRRRSSSRTAIACSRSSRTSSRTPSAGRPTAGASTSSCRRRTAR